MGPGDVDAALTSADHLQHQETVGRFASYRVSDVGVDIVSTRLAASFDFYLGGLVHISLFPVEDNADERWWRAVRELLVDKYGAPSANDDSGGSRSVSWLKSDLVVELRLQRGPLASLSYLDPKRWPAALKEWMGGLQKQDEGRRASERSKL